MAIGDGTDAAAAGMALTPGSTPANQIDTEIIKALDYAANGHTYWKPGLVLPQSRGGLGATTAAAQRTALGLPSAGAAEAATPSTLVQRYSDGVIDAVQFATASDPTLPNHCTRRAWVEAHVASAIAGIGGGSYLPLSGGTLSGHLWLPASVAATSGYTIAYINSDGRVSRGASTERVKKYITQIEPSVLGDVFPDLFRFQMKQGDGSWRFGYIAERLAESDALRPFVVWETDTEGALVLDDEGHPIPASIDFISLLIVQVAQLRDMHESLAARVAALEAAS